ncbi:site-specific DNA-methyltransferase [Oscillibacter sp.]|uniref:site-specific DNA-methyltransferase n=1 Tax=Oscillibacter sp. TaxID=1945593 RepID=UPI00289FC476|nr:site-specific DNA-methyltransferase [Oscillibacter sp.]
MQIQKIPIKQLNPAKYNPRKDLQPGDPEYEKLLRSVEEFGYVEPIIWNKRTGNIVGGHQRFKVLKQLGFTEIDCVVVDMDEAREKALNIALNKISGDWDTAKLADVFRDIEQYGISLDITGFEAPEIDKLFQKLSREDGKIVEDDFDAEAEAAQITEPLTQPGDIWLLGKHRLMCGDSTDVADVAKLMDSTKAKMVFTDPPWNVDYGGSTHPSWKNRQILNDKMSADEFYKFLLSAFKAMAGVSEPGAMTYVVMSAQEWGSVMTAMKEAGYHWSSTIIWAKDSLVLSRKDYHTQYEPIWYGWLGGEKRLCPLQDRQQSDLWQIPRPKKSEEHPTMKPVALAGKAVGNSSRPGDTVLDLFGGSGTTLIACEQSDRVNCSLELDPKYCDVIVKRYIEFRKSDEGVFLLRGGEKSAYHELT